MYSYTFYRLLICENIGHCLNEIPYCRGWRLTYVDFTRGAASERKEDEIDGFGERHDKTRHIRIRHRNRLPHLDAFYKIRDDGTARAEHVAIAGTADDRFLPAALSRSDHHALHKRFRHTHHIDGGT